MPGAAAVDIPRTNDIPPQLSLQNERNHLDLGTQVITVMGFLFTFSDLDFKICKLGSSFLITSKGGNDELESDLGFH